MDTSPDSSPTPAQTVLGLASRVWTTQALWAAARLGIADHLAAGPQTAAALAAATGTLARPLHRVLRALASLGIFAEDAESRFANTPASELLRSDVPWSTSAAATATSSARFSPAIRTSGACSSTRRTWSRAREPRFERLNARSRVTLAGGDFFREVPGGDAYVLSHIIHDWDDERATAILRTIHRAADRGARVLLVETVIPAGNGFSFGKLLDIERLCLPGGIERTEREYSELLAAAGFRLERVLATRAPTEIIEGVRS